MTVENLGDFVDWTHGHDVKKQLSDCRGMIDAGKTIHLAERVNKVAFVRSSDYFAVLAFCITNAVGLLAGGGVAGDLNHC